MKVLGLPHDFNQEHIKKDVSLQEFCDIYKGTININLIVAAWEELTGNKAPKEKKKPIKKAKKK